MHGISSLYSYLKILICKGILRQVFICMRPVSPVYKLYKTPIKTTFSFGVFIVSKSMSRSVPEEVHSENTG